MRLAAVTAMVVLLGGVPAADEDDQQSVVLRAGPSDQLIEQTIDRLQDGDVLKVLVTDGEPGARGTVRQCALTATGLGSCRNHFPILFDDEGQATFQYQLDDNGACGADATCVATAGTIDDRGTAFTVFGADAPPAPAVTRAPAGLLRPGDEVRVDVSGLQPGAPVQAAFCAAACGPAERAAAGERGTASLEVTVGEPCRLCAVVVVGGASSTRLPVRFAEPPSARYDAWRLVAGLGAAAVFLLLAWRLVVTVDWRPPSEAATPEMEL